MVAGYRPGRFNNQRVGQYVGETLEQTAQQAELKKLKVFMFGCSSHARMQNDGGALCG